MAFFLNNSSISSHFRSHSKKTDGAFSLPRRGFHAEPGAREKALLAEDPALRRFKSHKKGVQRVKMIGDVLTIIVVAGGCYEIYVRTIMKNEEARQRASAAGGSS